MKLNQLVAASNAAGQVSGKKRKNSFLLYGPPKAGKTELAGTLAKIPDVRSIWWFDLENGSDTLVDMIRRGKLTEEQAAKIDLIRVPDIRESPVAMETLLKAICTKAAVQICDEHGRVNCPVCLKDKASFTPFHHASLTDKDFIVIDSLSQASVSAMNMACRNQPVEFKPTWDEYGLQTKWLSDLLTTVQAAQYTNFLCITHDLIIEEEGKSDKCVPLCGTKAFSNTSAKYFGTVIYAEMKLKQHKAGSSTKYSTSTQTGSRLGIELEKEKDPDLSTVLINAGFFGGVRTDSPTTEESVEKEVTTSTTPVEEAKPRFGAPTTK